MTSTITQPSAPQPPAGENAGANFWQRRLIQPIRTQLMQGASARELSRAVAISVTTSIFPILGTTTLIGLAVGFLFRLNQTVIHSINFLCTPIHVLLILPFARLGEKITDAPPVPFSIPDMLAMFKNSPGEFFHRYGATCLHCILGWAIVAPLLIALLYMITLPMIRRLKKVTFSTQS